MGRAHQPRCSGYPICSNWVIRVIQNSDNENSYSILVSKKHFTKFWVPDNLGSSTPDLLEFTKKSKIYNFRLQFIHNFTNNLCIQILVAIYT
jgi:hypothetical protein